MRLIKCHIGNFGCYSDREFDFSMNPTAFCLGNGEGKTTLAVFIRAMFYSLPKATQKPYLRTHYMPYSGGTYGGAMDIEFEGSHYRIERVFQKSASKDELRIFDDKGAALSSFKGKSVAEMQGEGSSYLGYLIFGIDEEAFLRCNYISSDDLDFGVNESIQRKIWDIAIDMENERSYEETMDLIDDDLRAKKPTTGKKENAYPYQINELRKKNKERQRQIDALNAEERGLSDLYAKRDAIHKERDAIDGRQSALSRARLKEGQWSSVKRFEEDIAAQEAAIDSLTAKYQNGVPSLEQINALRKESDVYSAHLAIAESIGIDPAEAERLSSLEGKILDDDEYERLIGAYSRVKALREQADKELVSEDDVNRLAFLEKRYGGKKLRSEDELRKPLWECEQAEKETGERMGKASGAFAGFPSEEALFHIDGEIAEHKRLTLEIEELKSANNEPSKFVKAILAILTFGIYLLVLRKKRKKILSECEAKERLVSRYENELDGFFAQNDLTSGSYELRMAELRGRIARSVSEQKEAVLAEINQKKDALASYFSMFCINLDEGLNNAFNIYRKEISEYRALKEKEAKSQSFLAENKASLERECALIDGVLSRHGRQRKEDFASQLSALKEEMDFGKRLRPLLLKKEENDKALEASGERIKAILAACGAVEGNDLLLSAKETIVDWDRFQKASQEKAALISKKERFIKENGLEGFVPSQYDESAEENLKKEAAQKNLELKEMESKIEEVESDISQKEALQAAIEEDEANILLLEAKAEIASLAKDVLSKANKELNEKYVGPVRKSFEKYAKRIHEKIGPSVVMNLDYTIKYDVKGALREASDLSDGERTIMMLALRFAVLDELYKSHDSLIILDDPFESLDASKLLKAKELLHEFSHEWQIVYFTCHESRAV